MKKKKIIILAAILCAVVCFGVVSGVLIYRHVKNKPADIRETPIPTQIDTADAFTAPARLEDVVFEKVLSEKGVVNNTPLFGKQYTALIQQSKEQFTDVSGIVYAEEKKITFYDNAEDKNVLYTSAIHRTLSDTYNADGVLVYSCTNQAPDVEFDAEPIRWFYKDGKPAAAELFFTDTNTTNFGTAIYDGTGALVCLYTEIFSDTSGEPKEELTYYNADFETIDEDTFNGLIPDMDAPQFLYTNWS